MSDGSSFTTLLGETVRVKRAGSGKDLKITLVATESEAHVLSAEHCNCNTCNVSILFEMPPDSYWYATALTFVIRARQKAMLAVIQVFGCMLQVVIHVLDNVLATSHDKMENKAVIEKLKKELVEPMIAKASGGKAPKGAQSTAVTGKSPLGPSQVTG